MSEDGDSSSGSSSKSESDEEVDNATEHEHGMVQTSTSGSLLENPSNPSADKSSLEVPSSEANISIGSYEPSDTQFRPSTLETSAGPELPVSLSQMDSIQNSTVASETNLIPNTDPPPPPPAALGSTNIPATKDALAAAIAHHDWNMVRRLVNILMPPLEYFEGCLRFQRAVVGRIIVLRLVYLIQWLMSQKW